MGFGEFKGNDTYYYYPKLYIHVEEVGCILNKKENHKEDYRIACDECYPILKEKIIDIYQSYCKKDNDFKNFDNPFCFDDTKKEISIHLSKNWSEDLVTFSYVVQDAFNDSNQDHEDIETVNSNTKYMYPDRFGSNGEPLDPVKWAPLKTVGSLIKQIVSTYEISKPLNQNASRFMNDVLKITGIKFEHAFHYDYDCHCSESYDAFDLHFSYNDEGEFPKTTLEHGSGHYTDCDGDCYDEEDEEYDIFEGIDE